MAPTPFWKTKSLQQMSRQEWESLCDGCAKCCLQKLQDQDSDEVFYTNIACRLLDIESCRCQHYTERKQQVPNCLVLTSENLHTLAWLPSTCAYRLVYEGKELPVWHHLVCADKSAVHVAAKSVRGRVYREEDISEAYWEDYVVEWPE